MGLIWPLRGPTQKGGKMSTRRQWGRAQAQCPITRASDYCSTVTGECSQPAPAPDRFSLVRLLDQRCGGVCHFCACKGAPHFVSLLKLLVAAAAAAAPPPPPSPPRGHHLHRRFLAALQTGDLAKEPQSRVTA